jgi:hypothetical protein
LNTKINDRIAEEQSKAKAKAAASESEALTANLRKTGEATTEEKPEGSEAADAGDETKPKEGETTDGKPVAEEPVVDEFAALGASTKSTSSKSEEKETPKKSKSKPKKSEEDEGAEEDEEGEAKKPRPAPVVEDEGLPIWVIPGGITLLAVIGIAVMKFMGIGGKKSEE